jgi:iron complex outermembrane receptor protein
MWNVDPYLHPVAADGQTLLDAGVRYSSVWFDSNDYYITPGNGDDSAMPAITNGCRQAR